MDLIALPAPSPLLTDTRFSPTEDTVFVVNATLTDYKLESGRTGDSDYHLVLMDDQGNTMVAEIPAPACVDSSSPVKFAVAGLPAGVTSQINQGAGGKMNLVLSAASNAPNGTFPITVTASASGRSRARLSH